MTRGEPLLLLEGIRLQAGARVLVEGLDLQVQAGEVWAVLGRNGAGKSTLLAAMAGLRAPQAGNVRLCGRTLSALGAAQAARLRAFLPQNLHDAFSATVLETVLLGRHPHLGRWRWEDDDDRRIALDALSAVDMAPCAGRDVLSLSGGERQRVGLAQVLAQATRLLLLDEPTAHLDLHHQASILETLVRLARNEARTVVFTTHDLNLAARFAQRVLVLSGDGGFRHGATQEVMSPAVLSAAFAHPIERIAGGQGAGVFVPRW